MCLQFVRVTLFSQQQPDPGAVCATDPLGLQDRQTVNINPGSDKTVMSVHAGCLFKGCSLGPLNHSVDLLLELCFLSCQSYSSFVYVGLDFQTGIIVSHVSIST